MPKRRDETNTVGNSEDEPLRLRERSTFEFALKNVKFGENMGENAGEERPLAGTLYS